MYKKLKEIRNKKSISIDTLKNLLGLKTKAAYYKKENGNVKFTLTEAKLIADLLKLPIEKIFFDQ